MNDRNIHMGSGNYNESISGDYIQGNKYIEVNKQSLSEAIVEIQALLKQLEKTYPTNTTSGKVAIAEKAIERIDNDPKLASRIISVLTAGGTSALDSLLDHPAANFVIAALQDWQETKNI